jgi:hypothetical protein
MFPRYVPPKNRRSYCLGIIFGFSKGTYLASGIASFHHFEKLFLSNQRIQMF